MARTTPATGVRDAFAGPAAKTTIVIGIIAAALAFAAPVVAASESLTGVPVTGSVQR